MAPDKIIGYQINDGATPILGVVLNPKNGSVVIFPVCQKCKKCFKYSDGKNYICQCGNTSGMNNTFMWRQKGICQIEC
jgi:PHP family Zn ribbon phosphoesterase